jgi:hypothetical protein
LFTKFRIRLAFPDSARDKHDKTKPVRTLRRALKEELHRCGVTSAAQSAGGGPEFVGDLLTRADVQCAGLLLEIVFLSYLFFVGILLSVAFHINR